MDLTDDHTFRPFLEVYGTLPRAGPGGDDHTVRALGSVPGRTPRTVLDLGCGPGARVGRLALFAVAIGLAYLIDSSIFGAVVVLFLLLAPLEQLYPGRGDSGSGGRWWAPTSVSRCSVRC